MLVSLVHCFHQLPDNDGLVLAAADNESICMKLDLANRSLMLFELADHSIGEL